MDAGFRVCVTHGNGPQGTQGWVAASRAACRLLLPLGGRGPHVIPLPARLMHATPLLAPLQWGSWPCKTPRWGGLNSILVPGRLAHASHTHRIASLLTGRAPGALRPAAQARLDVLDAETEGQLGFILELELANALRGTQVAALLTQVRAGPGPAPGGHLPHAPAQLLPYSAPGGWF